MRCRAKGFTLIELLIVVAIIAILALIAVPNFLEAQVRAKVSRVKADIRTIAVAEEAYYVDWNSYTCRNNGTETPISPLGSQRWAGFGQLTTPVAYITSIPLEVFGHLHAQQSGGQWRGLIFELGTGDAGTREPSGPPWNPGLGMPSNCFLIESTGPDQWDDTRGTYSTSNFPWRGANRNDVVSILAMIYDPTNGTVSRGEIMRVGGQKPAGAAYDALWMQTSK